MRFRFRGGWLPNIAVAILVPTFIALGFWQVDRAEQKKVLQAKYDRRAKGVLQITGDVLPTDDMQYQRVAVRGHYEHRYQILLDNQINEGRVGYQVITPLKVDGSSKRLLVNRGWVPIGPDRSHPPDIAVPAGLQEVTGVAVLPHARTFTLGEPEQGWAPVWQYLDMTRYQSSVPFSTQPLVVLLDPDVSGGFVRRWPRPDTGMRIHQGYAFQWFALATTLVVLFLALNLRKTGRTDR